LIGPGGKQNSELQLEQQLLSRRSITEEGVIEILGTDPAGIEAVAKINHFQATNE
jgi:polyribonucleotide nucleotidyltransferase